MDPLLQAYGRVLDGLMLLACLLLMAMTLIIGADVISRNASLGGIPWSSEVSEDILYLHDAAGGTLAAPARSAYPGGYPSARIAPRVGWLLEWFGDLLGLACSLYFVWYGCKVLAASYHARAISIKTLITPEWWMLAPLPIAFLLLAIEFIFRMRRLSRAERAPRADAVSAS